MQWASLAFPWTFGTCEFFARAKQKTAKTISYGVKSASFVRSRRRASTVPTSCCSSKNVIPNNIYVCMYALQDNWGSLIRVLDLDNKTVKTVAGRWGVPGGLLCPQMQPLRRSHFLLSLLCLLQHNTRVSLSCCRVFKNNCLLK